MKRQWLVLSILLLFVSMVQAQDSTEDTLYDLLESYRAADGPGVVLYVWTPDGAYSAAIGVFELGTNDFVTPADRFRIGSVSKTYTAVATLQLVDEGLIDLDVPIRTYLADDIVSNIDGAMMVTTRQLLTMTSGLYEYLQDDFYDAVIDDPTYEWTPLETIELFVYGEQAFFEPGEAFDYTNTNYLLLELIIESVTDSSLHEFIRKNILMPIGAESTYTQIEETLPGEFVHGYEDLDGDDILDDAFAINDGAGMGDGALIATAEDVALFYQALFYDEMLLDADTLQDMLIDPLGHEYGMGVEVIDDPDYGMTYGHSGSVLGFSSDARYFVEEDVIVVLLHADLELEPDVIYEALAIVLGE